MTALKKIPLFLLLLPVFFVFHGFTDNFDLIPVSDALKLTGIYLLATIALTGIGWIFYRDLIRSSLFAFLLMAIYFFFGSFQDALKNIDPISFLGKYKIILPLLFIFIIAMIIWLKKKKQFPYKIVFYLNALFLFLILWDIVSLSMKASSRRNTNIADTPKEFIACDTCSKPDIYLILADGYAGATELKEIFDFDNSAFETELRNRGFHIVPHSKSNYNFTPFVMASMLNMNYLNDLEGSNTSKHDMSICNNTINKSQTLRFLQGLGYDFTNYSIFDFDRQPSVTKPTFLPRKTKFLTSQTLFSRLQRDLWFHLVTDLKWKSAIKDITYYDLYNNNKVYDLTIKKTSEQHTKPRFVYTHLVMPHYPYYFDRNGKANPEELVRSDEFHGDKKGYTEYLLYANKKLLELVDHIKKNSPKPPVIVLMGDHGFREFRDSVDRKYHFMNLNAVLLPNGNYSEFYDDMSNVNQFRMIFNSQFGQRLQLLKDSVSFLRE